MKTIDFRIIAAQHQKEIEDERNRTQAPLRDVSGLESRLTAVRLSAKAVTWNPDGPSEKSQKDESVEGSTSTRTMTETVIVEITDGLCKGLNTSVRVPFPSEEKPDRMFEINPCLRQQQITYKTPMTLRSSPGGNASRVNAVLVKQNYNGGFECRVYPRGHILYDAQRAGELMLGKVKTPTAIAKLHRKNHDSVKDLCPDETNHYYDGTSFYFMLRGLVNLNNDSKLQHNWE